MRIPQVARKLIRRLRPSRPTPAILMYHRVATLTHDPWDLAVSPDRFDEQMAYLKRMHTPLPMDELAAALRSNTLPANAVAITFDDGYRDNLLNAKPILERHGIPATLFLATGWVNSPHPFWWDELADFTLCATAPQDLAVLCDGDSFSLQWNEPEAADKAADWRASSPPQTARQKAFLSLWRKLQRTSQAERSRVMATLRQQLHATHDPLSFPMSAQEVLTFAQGNRLSLGAHTVNHPALTSLSPEDCRHEIEQSANECRSYTASQITGFAYPYGDLNTTVRDLVAEAGFSWACSTRSAHLGNGGADLHALPRLAVPNCAVGEFAAMLSS